MKKSLATILATAMVLGTASVAFAAQLDVETPDTNTANHLVDFSNAEDESYTDLAAQGIYLYTYGTDAAKEPTFIVRLPSDDVRIDVQSGNVSVSKKKISDGEYKVTIKAKAGVRDFELEKFTVELESGNDIFYIKGKVAYSDIQTVASDEHYSVSKSDTDNDGDDGAVFEFDEVIDEETRIRCNDYVDVYFKGNYGTDMENMRVVTDEISEVEEFFNDVDVDYYDFVGTPKFATKVKVLIDGDPNAFVYEYNKETGDLTRIDADYESDGWAFTTKNLGCYVITEEEYEEGNTQEEEPEVSSEEESETESGKTNPGTGAYGLY